jgi:hypothetical protein
MKRVLASLLAAGLLLGACSNAASPEAKVTSAKVVEYVHSGGSVISYEGYEIVELTLDFAFDEALASDLDQASDDYGKDLFPLLAKGAHLSDGDTEMQLVHGYWPKEAGSNYAKSMVLLYIVPSADAALTFTYDGSVLGEDVPDLVTTIKPER